MRTLLNVLFAAVAAMVISLCAGCGEKKEEAHSVPDLFYSDTIPEKIVKIYVDIPAYVDTVNSLCGAYTKLLLKEDVCLCDGGNIEGCYRHNFDDIVCVSTEVLSKYGIPFRSKVMVSLLVTNINVFKKEYELWGAGHNPERLTYPKAYIQRIKVR